MKAERRDGRTAERSKSASSVGDALRGYLARSGFAERLKQASVVEDWPRIVGAKIAAISQPEAVTQDGTLFVRVKNAAWMQELQLMTPDVMGRLKGTKIKRIVWRAW